jgi:hypothetical protein
MRALIIVIPLVGLVFRLITKPWTPKCYVRFEVFTAMTMKNTVFWDVASCRSCLNRRFGGTYQLKMEAIHSSETSVHTRSTQRHIPEDGILHRNANFFFQKQYFSLRIRVLTLYRIYLNFFAVALIIRLQIHVILLSKSYARLVWYGCWYTQAISNAKLQETLHFERNLDPDGSPGFVVLTWSSGR